MDRERGGRWCEIGSHGGVPYLGLPGPDGTVRGTDPDSRSAAATSSGSTADGDHDLLLRHPDPPVEAVLVSTVQLLRDTFQIHRLSLSNQASNR